MTTQTIIREFQKFSLCGCLSSLHLDRGLQLISREVSDFLSNHTGLSWLTLLRIILNARSSIREKIEPSGSECVSLAALVEFQSLGENLSWAVFSTPSDLFCAQLLMKLLMRDYSHSCGNHLMDIPSFLAVISMTCAALQVQKGLKSDLFGGTSGFNHHYTSLCMHSSPLPAQGVNMGLGRATRNDPFLHSPVDTPYQKPSFLETSGWHEIPLLLKAIPGNTSRNSH